MKTKVVNKYRDKFDVYIGRGSPFGNPYTVKKYGREHCLSMFRDYFYERLKYDSAFRNSVLFLKGKVLG